jgi:hypothetical protein
MDSARRILPALLLVGVLGMVARLLFAISGHTHWSPKHDVALTRMLAGAFLISDLAIGVSLITLLTMSDRRPPAWLDRRYPTIGEKVWTILVAVVVVCYVSLAPTWVLVLVQMRR